jgi:hypothetical protein
MDTTGVWFLGVIAVASVGQAAVLAVLALGGLRLARRLNELQARLDREIRPTFDHLSRITRNLAEVSDLATLQARRVDYFLADTLEKLEDLTSTVRRFALRPLGPLADLIALVKGLRRGLDVYRELAGAERRGRMIPRRGHAEDDEHLFI